VLFRFCVALPPGEPPRAKDPTFLEWPRWGNGRATELPHAFGVPEGGWKRRRRPPASRPLGDAGRH
jgi:hypothetical protein